MEHQAQLLKEIVSLLNELHKMDPEFTRNLVGTRFLCNEAVANHPSVQVGLPPVGQDGFRAGVLGVLNGLLPDITSRVCALYDDDNGDKLLGFDVWTPEVEQ